MKQIWLKKVVAIFGERLTDKYFVVQNNILSDNQFGFRHNLSTYMALLKLTDKISKELNKKQYSISIFWTFPRLLILYIMIF